MTNKNSLTLNNLGMIYEPKQDSNWKKIRHLNELLNVKTDADMLHWIDQRSQKVKSKRIARDTKLVTLDGLFS
jgi:hypothetical protein